MSEWLWIEYARIRRAEIDRELEAMRLVRMARSAARPSRPVGAGLLVRLGNLFVACGVYLQRRYGAVAVEPAPTWNGRCCG